MIDRQLPPRPDPIRRAVYGGRCYLLPSSAASWDLVRLATDLLEAAFDDVGGPRAAQHRLAPAALLDRLSPVRRALAEAPQVRAAAAALLHERGLDASAHAFDAVRLRAVLGGGHRIPAAAPVYFAHRDTWYANPRAQLNWWIPLHDVTAAETFRLYPARFAAPVANDSAGFDYPTFRARAGWQATRRHANVVYPRALEPLAASEAVGFEARAGQLLLFSGAHLHQTCAHEGARARLSLDLRTVHRADHEAGRGAPDPDNRSTGSALVDYR